MLFFKLKNFFINSNLFNKLNLNLKIFFLRLQTTPFHIVPKSP